MKLSLLMILCLILVSDILRLPLLGSSRAADGKQMVQRYKDKLRIIDHSTDYTGDVDQEGERVTTLHEVNMIRARDCINDQDPNSYKGCCRRPFIVDLDLVGFETIIYPRSYHAYYCSGDCSNQEFVGQSNSLYSNFMSRLGDNRPNSSCCVPVSYSGIEVLHVVDEITKTEVLPGMQVPTCACMY